MKEVRIAVRFKYDPSEENYYCCKACVRVSLPVGDQERWTLEEVFISPTKELLGEQLCKGWGRVEKADDGFYRFREVEVEGQDWGEVEQKCKSLIEEIKETLVEVKRFNEQMERAKPVDRVVTIII